MVVFARDATNVATDPVGVPQRADCKQYPAASSEAEDLDRLQTVVEWLNRERIILALETAVRKPSLRPVRAAEVSAAIDDSGRRKAGSMPFVLSSPLVSDRLQQPLPPPRVSATTLFVLTAITIAGLIGYCVYESASSALEMAQATLVP